MLIKRYDGNPILGPESNCPWGDNQSRNPGVVFDGKTFHMLFTAASNRVGDEALYLGYASSADGFNFKRSEEPFISPSDLEGDFDWGTVEDTRITTIDNKHHIAYAGRAGTAIDINKHKRIPKNIPNDHPTWTRGFRRVGLAVTEDFKSYEKLGPITSEFLSDANVVLFPEKINGQYAMLHRPTPFLPGYNSCHYTPGRIFIKFSDSLTDWEYSTNDNTVNIAPKNDYFLMAPEQEWESQKIGAAGVPILTDEGYLSIYHAKDVKGFYRCGLMLLDRENPRKVLARTPEPVFVPETKWEKNGRIKNTVFPCANIEINGEVMIYYGASDEFVCVATSKLKDLLAKVLQHRIK